MMKAAGNLENLTSELKWNALFDTTEFAIQYGSLVRQNDIKVVSQLVVVKPTVFCNNNNGDVSKLRSTLKCDITLGILTEFEVNGSI